MQMVLTPNDLFSWNNKYSKYTVILLRYICYNGFTSHLPAMHVNLLCACWYSWAVKGSSSSSFCRLSISLWFTSCLLLCPKLTDASHSGPGAHPPLPFPKWRLHSQGPHTLPFQGTRQQFSYLETLNLHFQPSCQLKGFKISDSALSLAPFSFCLSTGLPFILII
jgi:hypothetical protein